MKRVMIAISLCYGISMGVVADEAAPSVSVKRLALESANRIALGAIEACRKQGIQIGVTVVDRDGTVQAVMRDTIAAQI
ncbi:MAG: heme-binding protein, partial [Candidatus Thiodiazotropha endolucinida]